MFAALFVLLLSGCAPKVAVLELADWHVWSEGHALGVVQFPAHLDKRLPEDAKSFTLTTRVTLPPALHGDDVWLLIPYYEGQAMLTVDGIAGARPLRGANWRHHNTYRWHVPTNLVERGVAHTFSLEVQRTFLHAMWFDTRPMLAGAPDTAVTVAIRLFNEHLALVAFGILMEISIAYLLLYQLRRDARSLWFVVLLTGANAYNLDLLGVTSLLVGPYDTAFTSLALATAAIASVYFVYAHFSLGRPPRGWRYMLTGAVVGVAVCARREDTSLAWLVGSSLAPAIVLNFWVCTDQWLRNKQRVDAGIILAAWTLLTFICVSEFCAWIGRGEVLGGIRLAAVGLAGFGLMLSFILTNNYGQSVKRTAALNEELLRQIKDRSRQLHNALALAGSQHQMPIGLEPGQMVQGRYRVVRNLGNGGMGAVYEVTRVSDGQALALKVARYIDGAALARLAREAELGSQIRHANVVTLLDVDVADAGFIYIVMELISGPPLALCQAEIGQSLHNAFIVLQQIARGLHALHRHGVIHRDLKPANVLTNYPWRDDPLVKIADFGISRLNPSSPGVVGAAAPDEKYDGSQTMMLSLTQASGLGGAGGSSHNSSGSGEILTEYAGLIGTPRYMAPELAHGSALLTPAADIFSLGVIAYELLLERYPFEVPPVLGAAQGIPFILPPPLASDRLRAVHPQVLAILQRCLDGRAEDRPNAEAVSLALASEMQSKPPHI